MTESQEQRQALRDAMYGENDLSALSLFSGNFINYGYWDNVDLNSPLTEADRTRSQADLYREVVARLGPTARGDIAEIGCGIGVGAALVLEEFEPRRLHGLDLSAAQLRRAEAVNASVMRAHPSRLEFRQGSAMDLPWGPGSFDGIYSVEAAQHFEDLAMFAVQLYRALRPEGRISVATFFTPDNGSAEELATLLETVASGVDYVRPVDVFTTELSDAGFREVSAQPIGAQVWAGLDAWIAGTEYAKTWGRNWYTGYKNGWMDYYIVTAVKPKP